MPTVTEVFGVLPHRRPIGDSPLDAWLKATNTSRHSFAKALGVSPRTVMLWANAQSLPDLVNAFRISEHTQGGVLPEMWMGTDLAKFQYTHDRADWEGIKTANRRNNKAQYIKRVRKSEAP